MGDVVGMNGEQPAAAMQPQPAVVSLLETLLEQAQAGNIQHVVCLWSDGKTSPGDAYAGSGEPRHVCELVGSMELCKHTMLMSQFSETTESLR